MLPLLFCAVLAQRRVCAGPGAGAGGAVSRRRRGGRRPCAPHPGQAPGTAPGQRGAGPHAAGGEPASR